MPARFLLLLLLFPRHASGITLTWPSSFVNGYVYGGNVGTTSSLSFVISLPRLSPGQAASIGPMSLTIRCLNCDRFLADAGPQMTLSASQSDSCNALGGQQNTALHRCSPTLPFSTSTTASYTFTVTNNNVLGSFDFTLGMTQTCSDASAITIACVTPTPSTTSTVTPSSSATSTSTRSGSSTVSRSSSSTRSVTSTGTPSMTRTRSVTPSSTSTSTLSRSSTGSSTSTSSSTGSSTSTSSTTSTQSSTSSLTSTSSSSWSAGASASGTSTASLTSSSSSTQSTTSTSTATSSRSSTSSSSSSSSRTSSSSSTSSSTPSATGSSSSPSSATSTSYMTSAASFLPSISTATAQLYLSTVVDVSAVSARPQSAPDSLPTPTAILCTLQVALAQGVGVSVEAVRFSAPQPSYFNLPSPLSTTQCEAALMSLNFTTARRLELQGSARCAAVNVSAHCVSDWLPLPMNRSVLYQSRIMLLIDLTHSNTTPTALAALLCTAFSLHALAPTRVQAEPLATLSDRAGVDVYLSYASTGTADGLTCVQAAAADWVLMPANDVVYMPPSSGNSSSSSVQASLLLRALSSPVGISTSVLAAIIASTLLVALTCAVIGGRRRYHAKLKEYLAQQLVWGRGGSDPRIDGVADAAMSGCAVAADTLGGLYDSTRWMQVNPISKTRTDRQASHNDAEVERRLRLIWCAARTSNGKQWPQRPQPEDGGSEDPVSHCETVLRDCIATAMSSAAVGVEGEAAATCVAVAGDAACAHLLQEQLQGSSVPRPLATNATVTSKASAVTARPLRTSVRVGVRAALDAPQRAENLPDSHTGARVSMDAVMTAVAIQVERVVLQPGCHDDAETATSVSTLPATFTATASSLVSMLASGLRARPASGAESDVGDTFADLLDCFAEESSVDAGVYVDRHNSGSLEGMRVDASASYPAESGFVSAVRGARSSRAQQRSLVAASKLAHALPSLALPKPVLASTLLGVSKRVAAEALKVSDANRALRLRSAVTPMMVQRAVSSCVAALVEADIVCSEGSELVVSAAALTRASAQLAEHVAAASSSNVQGISDARARATRAVLTTPWHASSPAALAPPSFNACVVEEVVSWLQSKPGTQKDKARFSPMPSRHVAASSMTTRRSSLRKKESKLLSGDASVSQVNPLVSSRTQAAGAGSSAVVNDGDPHENGSRPSLLVNSTRTTPRQLKSTRSLVSAAGVPLAEAAGAERSDSLTRRGSSRRLFTAAHVDRPQSRTKQHSRVMMIRGDRAEDMPVGTDRSLPVVGSSMRRVGYIR